MNELDIVAVNARQLDEMYDTATTNSLMSAVADLRQKLGRDSTSCDRDHCTVEERAVIEAAAEWKMSFGFVGNEARWLELSHAADNLLTARAKERNDSQ